MWTIPLLKRLSASLGKRPKPNPQPLGVFQTLKMRRNKRKWRPVQMQTNYSAAYLKQAIEEKTISLENWLEYWRITLRFIKRSSLFHSSCFAISLFRNSYLHLQSKDFCSDKEQLKIQRSTLCLRALIPQTPLRSLPRRQRVVNAKMVQAILDFRRIFKGWE